MPHLGTVKAELLSVLIWNTMCHIWALLKLNCCPSLCWNTICHIWIHFPCFQLTLIWTFFIIFYLPFRDVFFYCCPLFEAFEMSKFLMMFLSAIFICYHKQFEIQYDIFIEIMLWLTMFWILFVSVVIYYFVFVFVHIFCVHVTDLAHLLCD